jgi:uncharacterized membrane protein
MMNLTTIISTVTAAFLASFVEVVEAFTIVLAVALTRSWRPALIGTGLALVVLAAIVIVLGPVLGLIPIHVLQFAVGVLLILFGMRWLRKAILRAVGVIAIHDEEKAFTRESEELHRLAMDRRADYLAGLAAFKAVLLEGVEVVFIVIAIGTARGLTLYASFGALAALLCVAAIGFAVHRPLSQVPENTLKFLVGLMLTTFGIFWTAEGLGAEWPGGDLALVGLFVILAAASLALIRSLERPAALSGGRATP